ncbi:hypothetical protein ACFW0I_33930 [[Kitasatospora] papulosa]|uniref:hypothetical protein n=1 Tax=[Kitasatospora] papulosa TaxID=1464011 RepID=UPI0036AF319C
MSTTSLKPAGDGDELIGRCYTKARRTPLVVGSVPGGAGRSLRLPGGPYTLTQLTAIVASFLLLILTRSVWGGHGLLDVVVLLGAPVGAAFALRHLHIDGRNPAAAAASAFAMLTGPRWGRLKGRPYKPARPCGGNPVITLAATTPVANGPETRVQRTDAPPTVSRPGPSTATPVSSGVQTLLARRAQAGQRPTREN